MNTFVVEDISSIVKKELLEESKPRLMLGLGKHLLQIFFTLGLDELLPHQELLRRGMLVQWEARMRTVIFISHQWTSFDHPDHTGRQLHTVQRMLERMVTGDVPAVDAPFADQTALRDSVKIAPSKWKHLLDDSFVWIDYAGVPQMKAGSNSATSDSRCVGLRAHSRA